jgi:hypothetical protein
LENFYYEYEVNEENLGIRLINTTFPDNGSAGKELESQARIIVKTSYRTQLQMIWALSWICAAFRHSDLGSIAYSSISLKAINKTEPSKNGTVMLSLTPLEQTLETGYCWPTLFPTSVVAKNFSAAHRIEGKGLEISFADMVFASKCLSFVEYEKGLIAHGLTSVLLPVSELSKDDALQWHFESKMNRGTQALENLSQILKRKEIDDFHKELDPERLVKRRCFLGWAENADIMVGTKDYPRDFGWSEADKSAEKCRINSYSFTFGSGFFGVVTATGSISTTPASLQPSILSPLVEKDIYDIIAMGKDEYVLLYDTYKEIGWYLPRASMALHIAHVVISECEYKIFHKDEEIPQQTSSHFAMPSPDGFKEAARVLKANLQLKIRKGVTAMGPFDKRFEDIVKMVWHMLSNVGTGLEGHVSEFDKCGESKPKYIHGVEFREASTMKDSMQIKKVKIDQPWAHLTSDQPIVILSRNFENAIVSDNQNLCETWKSVPNHKNHLAMMGNTVHSFLDKRSKGLHDMVTWHCDGESKLIRCHQRGHTSMVVHAQKLSSKKPNSSNMWIRKTIKDSYQNSCFIFGSDLEACEAKLPRSSRRIQEPASFCTDDGRDEQLLPGSAQNSNGIYPKQATLHTVTSKEWHELPFHSEKLPSAKISTWERRADPCFTRPFSTTPEERDSKIFEAGQSDPRKLTNSVKNHIMKPSNDLDNDSDHENHYITHRSVTKASSSKTIPRDGQVMEGSRHRRRRRKEKEKGKEKEKEVN